MYVWVCYTHMCVSECVLTQGVSYSLVLWVLTRQNCQSNSGYAQSNCWLIHSSHAERKRQEEWKKIELWKWLTVLHIKRRNMTVEIIPVETNRWSWGTLLNRNDQNGSEQERQREQRERKKERKRVESVGGCKLTEQLKCSQKLRLPLITGLTVP